MSFSTQPSLGFYVRELVGFFVLKLRSEKMKNALILTLLLFRAIIEGIASEKEIIVKGYVIDIEGNRVKEAFIELTCGNITARTISDTSGFFTFIVKPGIVKIKVSHIAYKFFEKEFKIFSDTLILIQLHNRVINLDEITITATRYQKNTIEVSNFVEVINEGRIERGASISFGDILKDGTSLYIRDYGGNPAQLKTLSLRGTGSEHVVFLLNGIRISSYQNGVLDLSLIPVDVIERVEIIHSNMSSLYGADAVGGVVNIITKNGSESGNVSAGVSLGSFGYGKFNMSFSGGIKNWNYISSASRVYGSGDFNYRYRFADKVILLKRKNAHFNISNLYFGISNRLISLSALYVRSNRGIPAQVTKFDPTSTANQFDEDFNLSLSLNKAFYSAVFKATLFLKNSYLHYTNNDVVIAGSGIDSYSHNLFYSGAFNLLFKTSFDLLISSGIETSFGVAKGNSFERAKRFNFAFFISGEKKFNLKFLPELKIYPMLRSDYFSDFGSKLIYKVGLNSEIVKKPSLNLKFSYGTGFRAPTFNDLYWAGSGNKNLKPEFSSGFDFGIAAFFESNLGILPDFKVEVSFFNIDIENRIVWLPSKENQSVWKPVNIDYVNSKGIEIYSEMAFFRWLKFRGNFSVTHSIRKNKRGENDATQNKQLIYIPLSTGNAIIETTFKKLFFVFQVNYTGLRYTTETNDRWLQPYCVVDFVCGLSYQFKVFEGKVKFMVKNLFDESYETMVGYPMPLRSYFVEFYFKLKGQTK